MKEKKLKTYREVGEITAEVRDTVEEMVEPGVKLLEISETTEELIQDKGAKPAFPCNVSVNEIAAHYSPPEEDEAEVEEGDLVKVDIGAHVDGYIADTAVTVATNEEGREIINAVNEVLEKAIQMVKPGVNVGEIGALIEKTAEEAGYKPIENLSGHSLARWSLHSGVTIPNVEKDSDDELEEDDVIAIEPFVTDGAGEVDDEPEVYIFRYVSSKDVSGRMARQTIRKISKNYGKLPFAERWLARDMSKIRLQMTIRELLSSGAIHPYYVLKEIEDGMVAQAEHTLIVTEDGCEVTTRK
ncbi:MAG: type II methionyl aminopeptidase [Hadesarchaea archaeon]|nr:type II methionyl aminopeptidase [Hadesarchaea archaeon]